MPNRLVRLLMPWWDEAKERKVAEVAQHSDAIIKEAADVRKAAEATRTEAVEARNAAAEIRDAYRAAGNRLERRRVPR